MQNICVGKPRADAPVSLWRRRGWYVMTFTSFLAPGSVPQYPNVLHTPTVYFTSSLQSDFWQCPLTLVAILFQNAHPPACQLVCRTECSRETARSSSTKTECIKITTMGEIW
jgi:hypothetical protein